VINRSLQFGSWAIYKRFTKSANRSYQLLQLTGQLQSISLHRSKQFFNNYIMNPCIVCELTVRPRQQASLHDGCQRWQHRTCNTGIGQDDYREAVRLDQSINWRCYSCEDVEEPSVPILSSTHLHADRESTPLLFSDHSFQSDLSQSMVRIRWISLVRLSNLPPSKQQPL